MKLLDKHADSVYGFESDCFCRYLLCTLMCIMWIWQDKLF